MKQANSLDMIFDLDLNLTKNKAMLRNLTIQPLTGTMLTLNLCNQNLA